MNRDYSKTLIYKLACNDPLVTDFYLGYTTFSLVHLCDMFRVRCKNDNWHVCDFILKNGGFTNWNIERLDCKPCTNSLEARTELRKHFDATPPTLNIHLPTRTRKEYSKREKTLTRQKEYRGENREKIIKDQAAIYQKNKERIAIRRREYFLANKDKVNERVRAYRARLKEARLAEKAAAVIIS